MVINRRPRRRGLAAVLGASVLAVSCGTDSDTAPPAPTAAPVTTVEPTTEPTTSSPGSIPSVTTAPTVLTPGERRLAELAEHARAVTFPASDGVELRGRLFGSGEVGIVLSHMGRTGDSQEDWFAFADRLAAEGYRALTYDARGVCSAVIESCSDGVPYLPARWQDVVGAADYLTEHGADRIILVGASIGAMGSLAAVLDGDVDVDALVWVAGVTDGDYRFDRAAVSTVSIPTLYVSSEDDSYGAGAAARQMYEWSPPPHTLELVSGSLHGTDMLADDAPPPVRRAVIRAIIDFIDANRGP